MALFRRVLRPCAAQGCWRLSWRRHCEGCGILLTAAVYLRLREGLGAKLISAIIDDLPLGAGERERCGAGTAREGGQ